MIFFPLYVWHKTSNTPLAALSVFSWPGTVQTTHSSPLKNLKKLHNAAGKFKVLFFSKENFLFFIATKAKKFLLINGLSGKISFHDFL